LSESRITIPSDWTAIKSRTPSLLKSATLIALTGGKLELQGAFLELAASFVGEDVQLALTIN